MHSTCCAVWTYCCLESKCLSVGRCAGSGCKHSGAGRWGCGLWGQNLRRFGEEDAQTSACVAACAFSSLCKGGGEGCEIDDVRAREPCIVFVAGLPPAFVKLSTCALLITNKLLLGSRCAPGGLNQLFRRGDPRQC